MKGPSSVVRWCRFLGGNLLDGVQVREFRPLLWTSATLAQPHPWRARPILARSQLAPLRSNNISYAINTAAEIAAELGHRRTAPKKPVSLNFDEFVVMFRLWYCPQDTFSLLYLGF